MKATLRAKTLRGAIIYFALVFGAGFLLGSVRVPFLVPRIGERYAELAEMPLMFAVIFFASRFVLRKYAQNDKIDQYAAPGACVAIGGIALLLLLGSELLLAVLLAGREVSDYLASRDKASGSVYLALLGVFAAMPWLQAHRQNKAPRPASNA